jgi:hypothetical protein
MNIPEIQEIVGGDVKVAVNKSETSKVTYESSVPLVFRFQAVQLS